MASYRASFGDLLEPGFRKIFDDRYSEIPQVFPEIFRVNDSKKQDEKDSAVTGFGLMTETAEGDPIQYEDPVQMYDVSYVHKKYTKGFKVSEELYEDDQYNVIKKKPAALARSARRTAEYWAAQVFNNSFNTSYLGGDAKPLASTSHPMSTGGTAQSNASATGITLTEANLETGLLALRGQDDDKGMKIMAKAKVLLVPPALEKEAKILVGSNLRSGQTSTGNVNDINVYKGALKIVSWDYLSSETAWFLLDSDLHELNWFWRIRPEFKQDQTFDTGMALFKARMRFSRGWSDWRGVWASKGDGSGYSD